MLRYMTYINFVFDSPKSVRATSWPGESDLEVMSVSLVRLYKEQL